jgi:hypothetical protein
MALPVSMLINGLDVRGAYGLEILSHGAHDLPDLSGDNFKISGRDGKIPGASTISEKKVTILGTVTGTSHSDLLTKLKALKIALTTEYHGLKPFVLSFPEYTDRYFSARLEGGIKVAMVGPAFLADSAEVEINVVLNDPAGIYNTLSFANVSQSPFSSPLSIGYNYQGSAITRPRITLENVGASPITALTLINTACKTTTRVITPATNTNIARGAGRWADVKGSGFFLAASNPQLKYTCQGNFNPGCFTIFMFFKLTNIAYTNTYLFSTTGNTISIYYNFSAAKWYFAMGAKAVEIADVVSGFAQDKWMAVAASFDGANMRMSLYSIPDAYQSAGTPQTQTNILIPTNIYIGSDATPANAGSKYIDDVRLFNYPLSGLATSILAGSEWDTLKVMTAPLPIGRGVTLYNSMDAADDTVGMGNTSLVSAVSIAQYSILKLDCDAQTANLVTATMGTPTNSIASISGEFPFLVPGYNGIQVVYTGSASGLNMAIEDKRRFL